MRADRNRAISGAIHHQLVPQRNGPPALGGKLGPSWGERREGPVRDVRLAADHIQFAAAVQFCSLS